MNGDVVVITEQRLPKPRGRVSERAQKAVRCYRGLWRASSATQKRRWSMALDQLLKEMTQQELAHYYKSAVEIRRTP